MPKVSSGSHDKKEVRDRLLADLSLRPELIQAPDPTVVPHRSVSFYIGYLQQLSADCVKSARDASKRPNPKRYPLRPHSAPESSTEILRQLLRQLNSADNDLLVEFLRPGNELLRIFSDIFAHLFNVLKQLAVKPHADAHYSEYDRTRDGLRDSAAATAALADAAGGHSAATATFANSSLLELVISKPSASASGRHDAMPRPLSKGQSHLLNSQSQCSGLASDVAGLPDSFGRASLNDLLNVQRALLHHVMPAGLSPYESSFRLPKFYNVFSTSKEPILLNDLQLLLLCVYEIARRPVRLLSYAYSTICFCLSHMLYI